ncbi:TPA: hypothetical protein RJS70_001695, partial [Campylobacter lari]|nr:hypothetical protein [Campylobacter lari]
EAKSLNLVTSKNKIRIKYSMLLAKGGNFDSGKMFDFSTPKYRINFKISKKIEQLKNKKIIFKFKGYVDDYLFIYLNDKLIVSDHKGGWTLCHDWSNIKCSPILSPLEIEKNDLIEGDYFLDFVGINGNHGYGEIWLKLDEVKVEVNWITD